MSKKDKGEFVREISGFRNWIGGAGNIYQPEKDRYHLYVSLACPWANRTLIMRNLKGLTDTISLSVVNPYIDENDWNFKEGPGVVPDPVFNAKDMREVYRKASENYTGYVSVPVLFDKETKTIVNNESSEIIRILNSAFDSLGAREGDYYPKELREEIDEINERIYEPINNGVYKAGFAKSQEAYDKSVSQIFQGLDFLEKHLEGKTYLVGDRLTEADIRLFVTLIRFDPVYYGHFKCNLGLIKDYPNLSAYTKRLYQREEFKSTIDFDQIKDHYYKSHPDVNPTRIVPKGPDLSWLDE